MSGSSMRRRTYTVATVALLTLVPATGTAVATDGARDALPVVTITMGAGEPKLTGTEKLSAGWVTFKISSTKDQHNLWLYTPKPGTKQAQANKADQSVRNVRSANARTYKEPQAKASFTKPKKDDVEDKSAKKKRMEGPTAAERSARNKAAQKLAADAQAAEKSLIALGGAFVAPKRPTTMTVKLPEGEITIADLAMGKGKTVPITVLKVAGKSGKDTRDAKGAKTIELDDSSRIQAPATLPRKGELLFSNIASAKWHFLGLQKLAKGATENDLVAYFDSKDASREAPFDARYSAAAAPLSGGRSQYLSYDLPPGKYALLDAWVDSETGRFWASQGASRVVTLK